MGATITRRSLLSGTATTLGTAAARMRPGRADATLQPVPGRSLGAQVIHLSIPFGKNGLMGDSRESQAYAEQVVRAAVVPPLSEVAIYAHGWLTDTSDLMLIYDVLTRGFEAELRALARRQAGAAAVTQTAPPLALPTTSLVIMTHWPSRQSEVGGPIGIADLLSWAGHSFGCRVLASALEALPAQVLKTFAALQTRNRINLVMLEPAMPTDALEPTDLTQAHPFGQLTNYQNLRILTTMSQWDTPLVQYYPAQEAHQPADLLYATVPAGTRQAIPALGGAGPTNATWRAFNGALPRRAVTVGPGFQYTDVLEYAEQRLVVADLSPLHATHHHEDMARPTGELPPFGRPDRRSMAYSGYHTDIYCREIYQLMMGFAWARHRAGDDTRPKGWRIGLRRNEV